jgi:hypothetical protein
MSACASLSGKKFKVFIRGRNYLLHFQNAEVGKYGFYTTVFVEAFNSDEAKAMALRLLKGDSKLLEICKNSESDVPILSAESADEITSFEGCSIPRTGLAFFSENNSKIYP